MRNGCKDEMSANHQQPLSSQTKPLLYHETITDVCWLLWLTGAVSDGDGVNATVRSIVWTRE
jgi:hypothetical protein